MKILLYDQIIKLNTIYMFITIIHNNILLFIRILFYTNISWWQSKCALLSFIVILVIVISSKGCFIFYFRKIHGLLNLSMNILYLISLPSTPSCSFSVPSMLYSKKCKFAMMQKYCIIHFIPYYCWIKSRPVSVCYLQSQRYYCLFSPGGKLFKKQVSRKRK